MHSAQPESRRQALSCSLETALPQPMSSIAVVLHSDLSLRRYGLSSYSKTAQIRFYIDPTTGLPHIYNHQVDETEVKMF
jgi:hypothetical protein